MSARMTSSTMHPTRHPRILLIRVGMLGDTVWGTTAIEGIRSYYGDDSEIDFIVKKGNSGLFSHDSRIGRVFEIRRRKLPLIFSPTKIKVLWRSVIRPYDLVIDLETSTHFRSLIWVLIARQKVNGHSIKHLLKDSTEHAVVSLRKIIALALPSQIAQRASPSLAVPQDINPREMFEIGGPYICIHPSNSWLAAGRTALRSWPIDRWSDLLKRWSKYFPHHIPVLIGTSAETELIRPVVESMPHGIDLSGRTNLPQLLAVIAQSEAVISTDTGPSHVAAALGVPVVSLFGPTQYLQTGPFCNGANAVDVLSLNLPCSPCVKTGTFEICSRNRCMEDITPEMVVTRVKRLLSPEHASSEELACSNASFAGIA